VVPVCLRKKRAQPVIVPPLDASKAVSLISTGPLSWGAISGLEYSNNRYLHMVCAFA
jgi:hypothetical protein